MAVTSTADRNGIIEQLHRRNELTASFFAAQAEALARVSAHMARRFRSGGRLLAFGIGSASSDAQHIAVEFVHPVVAGKKALPAFDLSVGYETMVPALARADDIVVGFSGREPDPTVMRTLDRVRQTGALCVALPGTTPDFSVAPAPHDALIHQEITEMLYHMLWESVQVFLEHQPIAQHSGAASFLYPFLDASGPADATLFPQIVASITAKVRTDERLRTALADQAEAIVAVAAAMRERLIAGGTILTFGNGGSATDATDFAADLAALGHGSATVPAVSLSADPATITAIANDVGYEAVFMRQLLAHGRPGDVAFAISTSGGSANVIAALAEARRGGLLTVALLGYDGGEIARRRLADHVIIIRSDQIPRIQEVQATAYHLIVELLARWRTH